MDFTVLKNPYEVLVPEIIQGFIEYEILFKFYGKEHFADPENKMLEAGPTMGWGLKYNCGIRLFVQYHSNKLVCVFSNNYEPDHILKHLPKINDIFVYPGKSKNELAGKVDKKLLQKYSLFRIDTYGTKCEILNGLNYYDAKCRMLEFERVHHNQSYHIEIEK